MKINAIDQKLAKLHTKDMNKSLLLLAKVLFSA